MMSTSPVSAPALVPSQSAEDGESFITSSTPAGVDRKAIAYLLRYETMVRQQETEHLATLAHLRPFLEKLSSVGGATSNELEDVDLNQVVSYQDLQQALKELEADNSFLQTDRQLMLVLETLTQKLAMLLDDDLDDDNDVSSSITWAEFLQCYKTVITGMQTLQHTQTGVRSRVKDRTISMISLFEPPSNKLLMNETIPSMVDIPMQKNTNNFPIYGGMSSQSNNKNKSSSSSTAKSLLLGAVLGAVLVVAISKSSVLEQPWVPSMISESLMSTTATTAPSKPIKTKKKVPLKKKPEPLRFVSPVRTTSTAGSSTSSTTATVLSSSSSRSVVVEPPKALPQILHAPKPQVTTLVHAPPSPPTSVMTQQQQSRPTTTIQQQQQRHRSFFIAAGGIVGIGIYQACMTWFPAGRIVTLVGSALVMLVGSK